MRKIAKLDFSVLLAHYSATSLYGGVPYGEETENWNFFQPIAYDFSKLSKKSRNPQSKQIENSKIRIEISKISKILRKSQSKQINTGH